MVVVHEITILHIERVAYFTLYSARVRQSRCNYGSENNYRGIDKTEHDVIVHIMILCMTILRHQ